MIATYLSLNGNHPYSVSCQLPSIANSMRPLLQSNLQMLRRIDVAVLCYVQGLPLFKRDPWIGREDELFSGQISDLSGGGRIAFIGCQVSFWGDIAGTVIRTLQQLNQVKCVLYVGKLGTLRPKLSPNKHLVTEDSSFVGSESLV